MADKLASPRHLTWPQLLVAYAAGSFGVGFQNMVQFLVPLRAQELGVPLEFIGVLVGAGALVPALLSVTSGELVDRFGARQAYIGGTRYYWTGQGGPSPVPVADNTPVFLVYRLDFGAGTTGDSIKMWVNPTPGVQPTDATANATWTISAKFVFTDNVIRLLQSTYWNKVTYDEIRLGSTYYSVAPDPIIEPSGARLATTDKSDSSPTRSSGRRFPVTQAPSKFSPFLSTDRIVFQERSAIEAALAGAQQRGASTDPDGDADLLDEDPWFAME